MDHTERRTRTITCLLTLPPPCHLPLPSTFPCQLPLCLVSQVWMHVCGAQAKMDAQPDLYNAYLHADHDVEIVELIEKGEHYFPREEEWKKVSPSQTSLCKCHVI